MDKLVIKNPVVIRDPDGVAANVSQWVKNFSPGLSKEEIDVAAYGDLGKATEKGTSAHDVSFEFYQSSTFSTFSKSMVDEFVKDGDTVFLIKAKDAAVTVDNPSFKVTVKVTKLGNLLGQRNTAAMFSGTWQVQGQIEYSDGAVTIQI